MLQKVGDEMRKGVLEETFLEGDGVVPGVWLPLDDAVGVFGIDEARGELWEEVAFAVNDLLAFPLRADEEFVEVVIVVFEITVANVMKLQDPP